MAADNVILNPGTGGDVIATNAVADGGVANGAEVQRVQVGMGAVGTYGDIGASNPLPVTLSDILDALMDVVRSLSLAPMPDGSLRIDLSASDVLGTVSTVGTVTTVTTVSGVTTVTTVQSVTNLAQIGGAPANFDQSYKAQLGELALANLIGV